MMGGGDPAHLMAAYFAGVLEPDDVGRLERWINESSENADRFARFAIEQRAMENVLRAERYGHLVDLRMSDFLLNADPRADDEGAADFLQTLHDLAEMEAHADVGPISLAERFASHETSGDKQPASTKHADVEDQHTRRVIVIPRPVAWSAIAALILLGAWLGYEVFGPRQAASPGMVDVPEIERPAPASLSEPAVVARLEAADNAGWAGDHQPRSACPLVEGEYQLARGSARVRFGDGALVIVEAPARFTLRSARSMVLHEGQLVSYCDESARGFVVTTPHAEFVDFGTEFGVTVDPWAESQLHVFKGLVQAKPRNDDRSSDARPILVRASEAVKAVRGAPAARIESGADNTRFLATRPLSVPVFNTGQVIRDDGADAHWTIVAVDGTELHRPLPAALFDPPQSIDGRPELTFVENQPDRRAWLTLGPGYKQLQEGNGRSLAFETRFDLGELDPGSARLELGFLADNYVSEIRLNGKAIAVPEHPKDPPFIRHHKVVLDEGFVAGVNTVRITAHNKPSTAGANYLALNAELSATAQLPWQRGAVRSSTGR